MLITLAGNFDDDFRDMTALFACLDKVHHATSGQTWKLQCRDCRYLGPWAAALLFAAYLRGHQLKQSPRIQLPTEPPALQAFCAFSGMEHHFQRGPFPNVDHPECETVPLEQFREASWDKSNKLIRLICRHTELAAEAEDTLRICIQEVIQNVVDHSESPIGGVMTARYMSTRREVRVAIVDRGVGVAASLRRQHPDTASSMQALQRVVQGNFSARTRPNNMGLGVSNLFSIIQANRGRMAFVSDDAVAEVHSGVDTPSVRRLEFSFPGTAVFFALPLSEL